MNKSPHRQSNIEILRIVAMLLVLLYHSVFLKNGIPSHNMTIAEPTRIFTNLFLFSCSAVCVNTFVFITGWYGLRHKKKGILSFIFQVLFYFLLGTLVGLISGIIPLSTMTLLNLLTLSTEYWFVYAYLGLYLFAPLLNSYIEHSNPKSLKNFLIFFYLFQTWYGWFRPQEAPFFYGGHSTLSFIGLYLLARYLRLYTNFSQGKVGRSFLSYLLISLTTSVLGFVLLYFNVGTPYVSVLYQYISPFTLLSSIFLFRGFIQWNAPYSPKLNYIAISAFSTYLIHTHDGCYSYMEASIIKLQNLHLAYPIYVLALLILLIMIYMLCTIFDQMRIKIWNKLSKHLSLS